MPISVEAREHRDANYRVYKDRLNTVMDTIDLVLAGESEAKACKQTGINFSSFRHFIRNDWTAIDKSNPIDEEIKTDDKKEYTVEEQIMRSIFGEDVYPLDDFWEAYEIATQRLTDKEKVAMKYRYIKELTLEEVGICLSKELDIPIVTRERARQIIAKALRKLRYPGVAKYFTLGVNCTELMKENYRAEITNKNSTDKLNALKNSIEIYCKNNALLDEQISELQAICDKYSIPFNNVVHANIYDTPIEDIELSVRSYNCLKRAGINALGDFSEYTEERLLRIRNLGQKSLKEVLDKLYDFGIVLAESDEQS